MKVFKSVAAVLLSAAMIISLTACHKKGETVMTVGETTIDSGLYLAFQYSAYSEFIKRRFGVVRRKRPQRSQLFLF